jgi:hypothetical protein
LVLTITWRIGRARAAARMAKNSGCKVGSPPEICTRSGSPSLATRASNILSTVASGRCFVRAGEESAKQTGQVRLQWSLISTSARHECCSWSGQSPQSYGQPNSVRFWNASGLSPGLM